MGVTTTKKTIVMVFLLLLLCVATVLPAEPVTIRYPHWFFGHGSNFATWLNGAVDAFEAKYPSINVTREQVPYEVYWDKVDTAIASGSPPDLVSFWSANLGKYIDADVLVPLDDLIDMNDVNKNFTPIQTRDIPALAKDGKTYALAYDAGIYLPMYRPSVFKAAGVSGYAKTMDEFIAMTKKLTTSSRYGFAFMDMPGNYNEQLIDLTIWTIAFGGHIGDANGMPTLDSPAVINAVSSLKKLFDAKVVPRDTDKSTYRKMFAMGKVATLIDGMPIYGLAVGWNPEVKNDFVTVPLPFPTQRVAMFQECNSIIKGSKHPKEAALFAEFLANQEQQTRLIKIVQCLTPRQSVFTKSFQSEFIKENPWYREFMLHADKGISMNVLRMPGDKQVEVQKILGKYFDKVLFENLAATEAMKQAQEEALRLFD